MQYTVGAMKVSPDDVRLLKQFMKEHGCGWPTHAECNALGEVWSPPDDSGYGPGVYYREVPVYLQDQLPFLDELARQVMEKMPTGCWFIIDDHQVQFFRGCIGFGSIDFEFEQTLP